MLEKKTVLSESGRVHRFQFLEIVDIVVERNILTRYVQKIISFISTRLRPTRYAVWCFRRCRPLI